MLRKTHLPPIRGKAYFIRSALAFTDSILDFNAVLLDRRDRFRYNNTVTGEAPIEKNAVTKRIVTRGRHPWKKT